jgi:hypothetical protein
MGLADQSRWRSSLLRTADNVAFPALAAAIACFADGSHPGARALRTCECCARGCARPTADEALALGLAWRGSQAWVREVALSL